MADAMFSWIRFVLKNRRHDVKPVVKERRQLALPMNCKEANAALARSIERLRQAVTK